MRQRHGRVTLGPASVFLASVCLLTVLAACSPVALPAGEELSGQAEISPELARSLRDRVAEAMQGDGAFRLLVNEEELNSYLAHVLQETWVRELTVQLTKEGVYLSAGIYLLGPRSMQASLDVTADCGRPKVCVRHASLDGHPLPRLLLASIQEAMNDALADANLPVRVQDAMFSEGSVLVTGTKD